jgi:methionyl-tRNA formyltransferase
MRVGFAGTPAFAATALAELLARGFTVPLVLTQPDRPNARGGEMLPLPVKALAVERGLPLAQPASLRAPEVLAQLRGTPLDVLVVAAYGLLLPADVLAWPRHGCLNIHASLLPRWRGAAPIQRALLAGDEATGVTIMQMEAGLDTGPMHEIVRLPIGARETGGSLHDRLAAAGARAVVTVLERLLAHGALAGTPQPAAGITYASKITRADTAIIWSAAARAIDRQIRAFDPAPGAATALAGQLVKLWRAEVASSTGARNEPGTVLAVDAAGLVVACGEGTLRVAEMQPAGGRRMAAAAYAAGRRLAPGARFDLRLV